MKKLLVVVDMQNDFITGALPNTEGQKIVPALAEYIKNYDGEVIATRDTHNENYMDTQEGQKLPIPHCIENTEGWRLVPEIQEALDARPQKNRYRIFDKPTFGCVDLGKTVAVEKYDVIELCGVCTDICVISNAMLLRAFAPETEIQVIADLCAGVTPETHNEALLAMGNCQIVITNTVELAVRRDHGL